MRKEMNIYKCNNCGKIIEDIKGEEKEIICCGEKMQKAVANSVDAAFEKHIPQYEIKEDKIIARVNHVMEEEHYIEWIAIVNEKKEIRVNLQPNDSTEVEFPYMENATIYAYCNKHGLWKNEVEK